MYIETFDTDKISKARDRWSGLSESDLRGIGNDSERLVDVVTRKGGMDREQAKREVDEFLESCGCCAGGSAKSKDPSASRSTGFGNDKGGSTTSNSKLQGNQPRSGSSESGQRSSASQSGHKPATSNDDQTGEMAAAQPGRKTRPDPKNM